MGVTSAKDGLSTSCAKCAAIGTPARRRASRPFRPTVMASISTGRVSPLREARSVTQRRTERIAFAFKLATARSPREKEVAVLKRVFEAHRERFGKDKGAAEKLLKVGESPRDQKLDATELSAWAMVANAILNLDEVVTRN